ncbi:MAG: AAA family ATPase [Chitinophagales bacterium]
MIHVHKDFDAVPKSLQLTEEEYGLLKEGKELDKSYYEQDVLDALTEVYGGKCGYCEEKVKGSFDRGVQAHNVFHYRPVKLYPWLMYEWSNLLLVCDDCLRRYWEDKNVEFFTIESKVDFIPNSIAEWKVDSKVLLNEQPLLLHPEIDNVSECFTINAEGILLPKNGNERALFTIGFFNLSKNRYSHEISNLLDRLRTAKDNSKFDITLKEIKKKLQDNINEDIEGRGYYQLILDNIEDFYQDASLLRTYLDTSYRTGNWLSSIVIQNVRHLQFVGIPLSEGNRKHLILTGKNGSGKTSVLENLLKYLDLLVFNTQTKAFDKSFYTDKLHYKCPMFLGFNKYYLNLINQFRDNNFLLVYFPAKRSLSPEKVHEVSSEVDLSFTALNTSKEAVSKNFLRYLINQKSEQAFSTVENEINKVEKIQNWFDSFEKQLQSIFEDDSLKLVFLRNGRPQRYTFEIRTKGRNPFGFNELADGYASFLQIVVELLLRIQHIGAVATDIEGIVLVDEIDAHLHVELQKKIMPLLTTFFPKIQFIVTTHSPFVLNSIENTVIYDLETNMRLEDASSISYSGLLEGFFKVSDEYSDIIKRKVERYEELVNKDELTDTEGSELVDLNIELDNLSPLLSKEMYLKFKDVQKMVFQG